MVFTQSPLRCNALSLEKITIILLQCLLAGSVLGLRVYAMYNFSKRILMFLLPLGILAVSLTVWSITGETWSAATPDSGCEYPVSKQSAIRMAAAWETQFLADAIVFSFTIWRAYRNPFSMPGSILSHMGRDGVLYFVGFALVNLANILMYYLGAPWIAASLSWFTSTLSVTMICRLMLHLHEVADVGVSTEHTKIETLHFKSRHCDEEANISGRD
ncbi:hypothetical protein C8R47DRAFT_137698 [Mycena vitilis]|nr:hypothetical protein C8R47DRAFT_137698 [Mycena vitilis]